VRTSSACQMGSCEGKKVAGWQTWEKPAIFSLAVSPSSSQRIEALWGDGRWIGGGSEKDQLKELHDCHDLAGGEQEVGRK